MQHGSCCSCAWAACSMHIAVQAAPVRITEAKGMPGASGIHTSLAAPSANPCQPVQGLENGDAASALEAMTAGRLAAELEQLPLRNSVPLLPVQDRTEALLADKPMCFLWASNAVPNVVECSVRLIRSI